MSSILEDAQIRVYKQNEDVYGHPKINFERTAALWNAYLGTSLTAEEVGFCMILFKIARDMNRHKRDNLVDIAGYAAAIDRVYATQTTISTEPTSGTTGSGAVQATDQACMDRPFPAGSRRAEHLPTGE